MWGLRMRGMWTGQKEGNSPKLYLRVEEAREEMCVQFGRKMRSESRVILWV